MKHENLEYPRGHLKFINYSVFFLNEVRVITVAALLLYLRFRIFSTVICSFVLLASINTIYIMLCFVILKNADEIFVFEGWNE